MQDVIQSDSMGYYASCECGWDSDHQAGYYDAINLRNAHRAIIHPR